ncbi:hypothetical protein FQN60_005747 [Etheostoma spectabile]|uniref:Uncharacterized protein n=1 Tax=Etheostoma spectabile TaxID=54343 RepID=A0A5J5CE99_9PERO|nr:hypothetical protein FQN60_005747 [Etheostoma spectabile]
MLRERERKGRERLPPHSVETIRPRFSGQWEEAQEQSNCSLIVH